MPEPTDRPSFLDDGTSDDALLDDLLGATADVDLPAPGAVRARGARRGRRQRLSAVAAVGLLVAGGATALALVPDGGGERSLRPAATESASPASLSSAASPTPSETSASAPTSSSPPTPADLTGFDAGSATYPAAVCGLTAPVTLTAGSARVRDDARGRATATDPSATPYVHVMAATQAVVRGTLGVTPVVVVPVSCDNNGGTASGAIQYSVVVFTGSGGTVHAQGVVTAHEHTEGQPPTLVTGTLSAGGLVVEEDFYGTGDPTCCPTGRATSVWTFQDGALVRTSTTVTQQPSP